MRAEQMLRPRIKPEHGRHVTIDGNIRIGATVHRLGVEIQDPDGRVRVLIGALDGSRSPDKIVDVVLSDYPGVPAADAMQQSSDCARSTPMCGSPANSGG
ncbi:hypothetical protein [Nocardia pseudovaccinii]|uniref:hypothetical protein n=1 Tax=Nocardia pseudovaccinii TaxID=189540 RepID=UPI0007A4B074|nr:hypothetical protein [Nocardia pseudovaccinii]